MNKNRIGGLRWRASGPMIAKPISIKLTGGKSGGCASKAVELTSGERIREQTYRTRGISLTQMVKEIATYLRGWLGYFGDCQTPSVLQNLESWLRRRECLLCSELGLPLTALLASKSVEAGAKKVGVPTKTLSRWLRDEEFRAEYQAVKKDLLRAGIGNLARRVFDAAEVLGDVAKHNGVWVRTWRHKPLAVRYRSEASEIGGTESPCALIPSSGDSENWRPGDRVRMPCCASRMPPCAP